MKKRTLVLSAVLFTVVIICSGCSSNSVTGPNSPGNTDTSFVNYVIITPTGGSTDTLRFTDRNLCTGSYSASQNNTYCLLNDTAQNSSVSLTFNGSGTGSPVFTFSYISYHGNGLSASTISGTVILYEAIGGKIKGTFSGSFLSGSVTYTGIGEFTVKRSQ
jgi:hypothetical protein